MTHRGPFQPLPFCDSVICVSYWNLCADVQKSHRAPEINQTVKPSSPEWAVQSQFQAVCKSQRFRVHSQPGFCCRSWCPSSFLRPRHPEKINGQNPLPGVLHSLGSQYGDKFKTIFQYIIYPSSKAIFISHLGSH